jgi:CBS domain-containing membrane protein
MNDRARWQTLLAIAGVQPSRARLAGALVSGLGGAVAIATIVLVCQHFVGGEGAALLVASMGASAVLLFALPEGPLSQPWAVIGGHTLSAIVGVLSASLVSDPLLAACVAVGGAIGVMQRCGCVHPPGGATALSAVVGGGSVRALGAQYVLTPVLLNAIIIVTVAVAFNGLLTRRRYPAYFARAQLAPSSTSQRANAASPATW